MTVIEETAIAVRQATRYINYVKLNYPKIHVLALGQSHDDFCSIGMSYCRCGWSGEYPVSGCPSCKRSFVE